MRPLSRVLALAASVVAVACFELSGPPDGVSSISELLPVAPSVADGDVMRDALARPAPLQLFAFDANGDTITDVEKRFVALDDSLAKVDADGLVIGARASTREAQFVGQVVDADGDVLQTPVLRLRVVPMPTAVLDTAPASTDSTPIGFDASAPLPTLAPFGFRVQRAGDPVPFWLVRFRIDSFTVKGVSASVPPVRLVRGEGPSAVITDTASTDGQGFALLRLQLVPFAMDPANLQARKTDTVSVTVSTVFYPGNTRDSVRVRDTTYLFFIRPGAPGGSRLAPARARPVY